MKRLRGLYAITDGGADLIAAARLALESGATVLQYRDKGHDAARRQAEAAALRNLCTQFGAVFIVNDDVVLAKAVDADGVHIGKDDGAYEHARAVLGREAIIGVSCYDEFERALHAQAQGADYVAFGSFFPSNTKPGAVRASLDLLHQARAQLTVPVVAIGGITPDNGAPLVAAGAQMLAVISGIFGAADVRAAAQSYAALFDEDA